MNMTPSQRCLIAAGESRGARRSFMIRARQFMKNGQPDNARLMVGFARAENRRYLYNMLAVRADEKDAANV